MRVVVTGASGFLGGVILKGFADAGLDCLGVSRKKVPGLAQVASYSDAPVGDVLIHLAEVNDRAMANRLGSAYERDAATTLRALLGKGYGRVIYASSAVLYGDAACASHTEADPVSADDTYTRVKLASEQAVLSAEGSVLRLANLYGRGMSPGNVFSHILQQLDRDGPVSLQDTAPVRDFLWIDDAVDAIRRVAAMPDNGIFNVGSGVGTSILVLAKAALDVAGQSERQIVSQQRAGRPSCIVLDTTETTKRLGWRPSVTLHEGLRRLVNKQPNER